MTMMPNGINMMISKIWSNG